MKIAVYSYERYDKKFFGEGLTKLLGDDNVKLLPVNLMAATTDLAVGCDAVCIFVNDCADAQVIANLAKLGVKLLLLRSAGFNHVDLAAAEEAGISVRRVPAYSPYAVAEMAVALLLSLVRKLPRAYNRVREHNFSISGLEGFDIHGKTIGIVGTGNIGQIAAKILNGFSPAKLLGYDPYPNEAMKAMGLEYVPLDELLAQSDIISLHLPLMPETYHMVGPQSIGKMKDGVVIINVSRGGLIDAAALEDGLRSGKIGGVGMDVYENEQSYFFRDCSDQVLDDAVLARLLTFHNVQITAHQAFLTNEALEQIASCTIKNLQDFMDGKENGNIVKAFKKI
mmetsp:Transcript_40953/g.97042  ORF Transcript_40953/g.97042 Transcript_40953/m.97042 type:complete len:338 (+) Transcript_40953:98-1111(+)|eukprot:CAMPEP_0180137962 /NCGR_PEP_ID=MMETSP0986-20121125/12564_1 /TAXON_ID=697907 /ORGANISM="non described non described, Strain CCMP2293" /LENGTH=337 /DNA_ID=CAMNT_0022079603 /DNA_START=87 /DNA_END=1100 /DNA_ORIENTATION=+